jgi:hypothetical protein
LRLALRKERSQRGTRMLFNINHGGHDEHRSDD